MRRVVIGIGLSLCGLALLHAQKPFQQYHDTVEHNTYALPSDWQRPAEWVFARLKYRDVRRFEFGRDLLWSMDYPAGDRHLATGIKRLTNIDVRSVEQVIELDGSDDIYNWPFLYAVEVGMWDLTEEQAAQLRDYLLRGGFLMVDDFHGEPEWEQFLYGMDLVFPDRQIIDLDVKDSVFHALSDIEKLEQIPGAQYLQTGSMSEKGGITPHFRGILDDRGRVMVVICHNMDLGDAIEWSDEPDYPEHWASLAYRVLTNYAVYDLTH